MSNPTIETPPSRLRAWLCGVWGGHTEVLHFEGQVMRLRCTMCGRDSPGWLTASADPVRRFDGDPTHHSLDRRPRLCKTA